MLDCHWKQTFGVECPGCGFQRSVVSLFKGNVVESMELFPATIPILFTFVFLILHLIFKFKWGARTLIISFATSAGLMLISYVMRLSSNHLECVSPF